MVGGEGSSAARVKFPKLKKRRRKDKKINSKLKPLFINEFYNFLAVLANPR